MAQAAYRVVQEGLTNALRYAAGAAVSVRVRGRAGARCVVEVDERSGHRREAALAGAGTGNGLRGLRERVGGLRRDARGRAHARRRLAARAGLPRRVTAPTS